MNIKHGRSRLNVVAVFAFCVVGAWASGHLVRQHADIWGNAGKNQGLFARICRSSEQLGFDCRDSTKGPWSQVSIPIPILGTDLSLSRKRVTIPVAFMGMAYFVFLGVWFALIGRPHQTGSRLQRLPLYVARLGGLISLFYVFIMATGHASWCLPCCIVHAMNFTVLLLIGRMFRHFGDRNPITDLDSAPAGDVDWPREKSGAEIRAIAVSLCIIAGLFMYRRAHLVFENAIGSLRPYQHLVDTLQDDPEFLVREYLAQPAYDIPPRPTETSDPALPELVVFTDFECPACYCNSQRARKQIAAAFNGRLQIRIRHNPLCHSCNPSVETEFHKNACEAACAAEAARRLGGEVAFGRMYASLFKNRKRLTRPLYRHLAESIGLPPDRFMMELDCDAVQAVVASDIALARELGVHGIPAMFLNGRKITELCDAPAFWKLAAGRLTTGIELRNLHHADNLTAKVVDSTEKF